MPRIFLLLRAMSPRRASDRRPNTAQGRSTLFIMTGKFTTMERCGTIEPNHRLQQTPAACRHSAAPSFRGAAGAAELCRYADVRELRGEAR